METNREFVPLIVDIARYLPHLKDLGIEISQ